MAHVDLRLVSGKPVELYTSVVTTIADARRQIAHVLKIPMECVRLVTSAGIEPNDDDHPDLILTDATTIVIDQRLLEEQFLQACGVESIDQLTALEGLDLQENQLSALPESIGQLTALKTLFVQGNQLSALPKQFGLLQALPSVHIRLDDGLKICAGTCATMTPSSSD